MRVSPTLDQASDREIERGTRDERGRFRALEGEDPMKAEEVTDDQLSVLAALKLESRRMQILVSGSRSGNGHQELEMQVALIGSWRTKEAPGPDSFATRETCWRVFRTAAILCDIAAMLGTSACWPTPMQVRVVGV